MSTHELQHTRLPCPLLSPRVCSKSCLLVSDAIQPFHPLSPPPPPALSRSQHQGLFQWVSSSHQVAKLLELTLLKKKKYIYICMYVCMYIYFVKIILAWSIFMFYLWITGGGENSFHDAHNVCCLFFSLSLLPFHFRFFSSFIQPDRIASEVGL